MKRNQKGFTLVELAVVLVIIGLLLAGILKGQELINGAKVKSLAADFRSTSVAYYGYQDKFHAIAGDDINVANHVTGGTIATADATGAILGNNHIEGNWNATALTSESYVFWQHVRLANLLSGDKTSPLTANITGYLPTNAFGGQVGITSNNPDSTASSTFIGSFYVCSSNISGLYAKQLDAALDDGIGNTGSMRIFPSTLTTTAAPVAPPVDSTLYVVCMAY